MPSPKWLLVWRGRNAELEVVRRTFASQYAALLRNAAFYISQHYDQTRAPELLPQLVRTYMGVALERAHTALYQDVKNRFVKRRGTAMKVSVLEEHIPALEQWTSSTLQQRTNAILDTTISKLEVTIRNQRDKPGLYHAIQKSAAFNGERARIIVATEANSLANAATHFAIALDFPTSHLKKSWVAVGDGFIRNSHLQMKETPIPYAEPFQVGTSKLLFPGDTSLGATPAEVVSCRCIATYTLIPNSR